MLTLCALFYGNHPDLARRLLESLTSLHLVTDIRLGLNDVGLETRRMVWEFCGNKCPLPCRVYVPPANVGKYPLMRRMFYDTSRPLAQHVMWFDDDSYLDRCGPGWWDTVLKHASGCTVLGRRHQLVQRKHQYRVIRQQPWCTKTNVGHKLVYTFATGGWWVANSTFLTKWNYPFPALHHNGGDSILGELVWQQSGKLDNFAMALCHCEACRPKHPPVFPGGVHINVGGRQGRRGLGRGKEWYVWQDGNPEVDLSFHDFECQVYTFGDG